MTTLPGPPNADEGASILAVSYGGGVQSNALLVLAAQGRIPHRTFLFANVGDDSEHPATLTYVREIAMPYARQHGIDLIELRKTKRDGSETTLWREITRPGSNRDLIPVRLANGKPGNRSCTAEFKIRVIGKWLRAHGASADNPARIAIGFSTDEWHRATNRRPSPYELPEHPLIALGHSRDDCTRIISDAGLPVPRRSACFFCPFGRDWVDQAQEAPELFARSVFLENHINRRRAARDRPPVWLARHARPLTDVVRDVDPSLVLGDDAGPPGCDDGHCWT